ncbi:asparagine synthase-related protein [Actinokineospora auranticolor]|uniref:asparagine synthase (glutamine-hydrolyzing) n=1 Tax=Actinokineospora auranticolor TaxID=155976 RepID=A0A2S6H1U0_9PSEU|nr:asparagine synthase-related protein [Actinokineospora auranticolor]PPK71390.1 asparagine synthase (glutamine-hydrolysing) [Actinokineospora auranticolor]
MLLVADATDHDGPDRREKWRFTVSNSDSLQFKDESCRAFVVGNCLGLREIADPTAGRTAADRLDALARAPGAFAVAVERPGEILLRTDPTGQFPLYTARSPTRAVVGDDPGAVAAAVRAPLDTGTAAACLACPSIADLFASATMFTGVCQVPGGATIRMAAEGTRVDNLDPIRVDSAATIADAAYRLRSALLESIRLRVADTPRVVSDFSGGLDSTSLAFLAAEYTDELPVITFRNPDAPVADDVDRAARYVALSPVLRHHVVTTSGEHLPYQRLVAATGEPHVTPISLGSFRARLAHAAALGARAHLVGEAGDVLLSPPAAYLADLARHGDLTTLWRHCRAWARLRTLSPTRLFRRAVQVGTTGRRRALLDLAAHLRRGCERGPTDWADDQVTLVGTPQAHWLTRAAAAGLADRLAALADEPDRDEHLGDLVTRGWLRLQNLTQRALRVEGERYGIAVHAPFLDAAVVRACLSLTAARRADPSAPKPLLRAALTGLVPDAVLTRPTKGAYSRDAYAGVRRAAPRLRALLAESAAADHGLLDAARVRPVLEGAIDGLPVPWSALNQVFAVELWLRERGSP